MSNSVSNSSSSKQVKSVSTVLRAVASGKISIGDSFIDCYILENSEQVISQSSLQRALGKGRGCTKKSGAEVAPGIRLTPKMEPFVNQKLMARTGPVIFIPTHGGRTAYGLPANCLPDVCELFIDCMRAGVLNPAQVEMAKYFDIIHKGLARVGVAALVNEACGIISENKSFLQQIVDKFIDKELREWTKRFPDIFFTHYRRWYGIPNSKMHSHCGCFINKMVYKELAPGVLEELRKRNPVNEETGRRAHAHHCLLTEDVGDPALQKQLVKVIDLMSISDNREEFEMFYEKHKKNSNHEGVK